VDTFLANEAKGTKVIGAHSLEEMVSKLKKPRRVMLMVQGKNVMRILSFCCDKHTGRALTSMSMSFPHQL
jgi:6-phosphogluconate dehydrogenase